MTNKEENKISVAIGIYFKEIDENKSVESVANAGVSLVRSFIEQFPNVDEKVDYLCTTEFDWDTMIRYMEFKKEMK